MHLTFCAVGLISSVARAIASHSGWLIALFIAFYFGVLLYARRRVKALSDEGVCHEFSSWWAMLSWAVSISFTVSTHFFQICADVFDRVMLSIALHVVLTAIHVNRSGTHLSYRIASYTSFLLVLVSFKYSVMPEDHCNAVNWICLCIGGAMAVQLARDIVHWVRMWPAAASRVNTTPAMSEQLTDELRAKLPTVEEVPSTGPADRLGRVDAVRVKPGLDRHHMCFEDDEKDVTCLACMFARSRELYFLTAVMALASCAVGIYFSPTFRLLGVPAAAFTLTMVRSWDRVRTWLDAGYAYVVLCDAWKSACGIIILACVVVRLAAAHAAPLCDLVQLERPLTAGGTDRFPCALFMSWGFEFQGSNTDWAGEVCALVFMGTLGVHHLCIPLPFHVRTTNHIILMVAVLYISLNSQDDASGRVLSASALPHIGIYSCMLIVGELLGYTMHHVRRRLFHDHLTPAGIVSVAVEANAKLAEMETNVREPERANVINRAEMAADKRLNHVIKGRCGSAISSIDLYNSLITPHLKHELPSELKELLKNSVDHLREAIEWCHRRQVFVQLEEKTYVSRPTPVDLRVMLCSFLSPYDTLVCPVESTVLVDETILKISVDEIVSNALKYRRKRSHLRASVHIGNGVLRIDIVNLNPLNRVPLSPEECKRVMMPGHKSRVCSAMSDGLGLDSVKKALAAASGSVTFTQDVETTTVSFELPASPCTYAQADSGDIDGPLHETSERGIFLEPSVPVQAHRPARAALGVLLRKAAGLPPLMHRSDSDSKLDGLMFREVALQQHNQAVRTAVGLFSGGDTERSFCSDFFSGLHAEKSIVSLATPSGHQSFLQAIFGYGSSFLGVSTSNDVVLVSESLNGVRDGLKGVDVAAHLREQGFAGVICGLAARQDLCLLSESAHIDVIVRGTSKADLQRAVFDVQAVLRLYRREHSTRSLGAIVDTDLTSMSERLSNEPSERAPEDDVIPLIKRGSKVDVARPVAKPPLFVRASEFSAAGWDETVMVTDVQPYPQVSTFQKGVGDPTAGKVEKDGGLRCFGLDDEKIPRQVQRLFMCHHLKADMEHSGVLGETQDEIEHFVDVALGHLDLNLRSTSGEPRPADVVLLDENIAPPHIFGSQIAVQLREKGFQGIIVLLTGASREQVIQLNELPAVDVAFEKGVSLSHMARAVVQTLEGRRLA